MSSNDCTHYKSKKYSVARVPVSIFNASAYRSKALYDARKVIISLAKIAVHIQSSHKRSTGQPLQMVQLHAVMRAWHLLELN